MYTLRESFIAHMNRSHVVLDDARTQLVTILDIELVRYSVPNQGL